MAKRDPILKDVDPVGGHPNLLDKTLELINRLNILEKELQEKDEVIKDLCALAMHSREFSVEMKHILMDKMAKAELFFDSIGEEVEPQ